MNRLITMLAILGIVSANAYGQWKPFWDDRNQMYQQQQGQDSIYDTKEIREAIYDAKKDGIIQNIYSQYKRQRDIADAEAKVYRDYLNGDRDLPESMKPKSQPGIDPNSRVGKLITRLRERLAMLKWQKKINDFQMAEKSEQYNRNTPVIGGVALPPFDSPTAMVDLFDSFI